MIDVRALPELFSMSSASSVTASVLPRILPRSLLDAVCSSSVGRAPSRSIEMVGTAAQRGVMCKQQPDEGHKAQNRRPTKQMSVRVQVHNTSLWVFSCFFFFLSFLLWFSFFCLVTTRTIQGTPIVPALGQRAKGARSSPSRRQPHRPHTIDSIGKHPRGWITQGTGG